MNKNLSNCLSHFSPSSFLAPHWRLIGLFFWGLIISVLTDFAYLIGLNAVLIFMFILFGGENEPSAESVFAYAIYFVCHFAIAAILVIHSLQKWTLSTNSLFILLFIASCLPLWMLFV